MWESFEENLERCGVNDDGSARLGLDYVAIFSVLLQPFFTLPRINETGIISHCVKHAGHTFLTPKGSIAV